MPIPVIAIFDIGKTNKKLFLFNEDYEIVFEKSENLEETTDEDGFPCEDINTLTKWVLNSLHAVGKHPDFKIKAINFSAHGASFVLMDGRGSITAPLYNYLKPFPDRVKEKFNQDYNLKEVCLRTASPDLGNLNSGLQLYSLKYQKPDVFVKINHALHLPEYFCFLLTGQNVSCLSSIGCHTLLWDFESNDYHTWVKQEDLDTLFAPITPSDKTFKIRFGNDFANVGTGLHDSSAALIPYLKKIKSPFVLISTGTWSISLNPFNHSVLTQEELNKDCLCYLSYDGKPVKASRLLIGPEHDEQTKRIAEHFHLKEDSFKSILFKKENLASQATAFEKADLNNFESADKAYHSFIQSLVSKQVASTQLILNNSDVKEIYVDGGFSSNPVYMNLLSDVFKNYKVFGATMAQASSLGAALVIHSSWNNKDVPEKLFDVIAY